MSLLSGCAGSSRLEDEKRRLGVVETLERLNFDPEPLRCLRRHRRQSRGLIRPKRLSPMNVYSQRSYS